jgi:hypothetical protein
MDGKSGGRALGFGMHLFVGLAVLLGACGPGSIKSPPPKRSAPLECPAGQVRRCLGECVVPQQAGQPCSPDECFFGALICAPGLGCARGPSAAEGFRCVPPLPPARPGNNGAFQACDPSVAPNTITFNGFDLTSNACANNTVCLRTFPGAGTSCTRIDTNADGTVNPRQGGCVGPAVDGEPCDSNWASARLSGGISGSGSSTQLSCRPCAPGLQCLNNRCRRGCGDPQNPGATLPDLNACPRNPAPVLGGSANIYQCRALFLRSPSPPNPTNQFQLTSTTPNAVCATCSPNGQRCDLPDPFSAPDSVASMIAVPIVPPPPRGTPTTRAAA